MTINAAESVCAGQGARDSLEAVDVFGGLSTLVDFHLVEPAMDSLDNPRFSLLETIRLFARERLIQAGETHQFDRRHAEFFLSIMIKAGTGFETKDERSWYAHIDRDLPDLRAALGWLHGASRIADMLAGASALGPYWLYRGQFAEGRHWLALALAGSTAGAVTVRARAQGWSARLALEDGWGSINPGEAPTVITELEAVRTAMANAQDRRGEMRASQHLSYALRLYGDHERATGVTDESLAVCHEPELGWWKAELLHRKALLSQQAGDDRAAAELARNCIAAAETSGNERIRSGHSKHWRRAPAAAMPKSSRTRCWRCSSCRSRLVIARGWPPH